MPEEREILEVDALFVGAGPASLAGAIRLQQLVDEHNVTADSADRLEPLIGVLEKGADLGAHALSGAVVDPRSLRELFPQDWRQAPFEGQVEEEQLWWMTGKRALSMPIPPMLENEGKYVASLGRLVKWMGEKAEAAGIEVFCGFPAVSPLLEDDRVIGIRTGDQGLDHDGKRKANYQPGVDVRAAVTVLGEGPRGTIAKQLEQRLGLAGVNPQVYAVGIKEVWDLPDARLAPGEVIHTMGWPLDRHTFGGGFIYGMRDNQAIVGLVVGLDYRNPHLDPHTEFQRLKTHPRVRALLAGGKMAFYGAKAIPEGGWWARPRCHGDGFLIIGDSGGFLNSQRLKGIHLAIKSGMLAAEAVFDCLKSGDASDRALSSFENKVRSSWIHDEMWEERNFHQAYDHVDLAGMLQAGLGMLTRGRGFGIVNRLGTHAGHERMQKLSAGLRMPEPVTPDGKLTFDKLADVYNSGTGHEEDQPCHLVVADTDICIHQCTVEYGNPCRHFCPAAVYEMVEEASSPTGERLQINASNCVHCKTCDIMDPYQIIDWVPPEGGGGPNYGRM